MPPGILPREEETRVVGLVIVFFMILSMPMLSVSVSPKMQSSRGRTQPGVGEGNECAYRAGPIPRRRNIQTV